MFMDPVARARTRAGLGHKPWMAESAIRTPVASWLTLASMFVYLAKVGNLPGLGGFDIGKVLVGMAVLALLFEGGGWKEGVFGHPVMRPYMALFAVALLTIPDAVWPGGAARYVFGNFLKDIVLVVLLIVTTRTVGDLRRVLWTVIANTLVLDLVLLHYGIHHITTIHLGKNGIAMTSVIAFGLLLGLPSRGIGSVFRWAAAIVLIYAIFMSVSRGSYIGVSLVLGLFAYFRYGNKATLAVLSLVLFVVGIYVFGPPLVHRTMNTLIHINNDYNLTARTGRLAIWKRGLRIIAAHPLGVGMRNFPIAEGHLVENVLGERWMDAHNALLEVTAELGIVGGIIFLTLLKRAMQAASRLKRAVNPELAAIGLSLVLALFGYFITASFLSKAYAVILYILVAAIVSADRINSYSTTRTGDVISRQSTQA
ncbi:MAG: O-antigen ligase family protein [Gammaproteobacteria bacterium]|nr:O-antigen ligase family protein [Gammaproteobacteria bacterium]